MTLIEVLVIILIAGILAAIVFSMLSSNGESKPVNRVDYRKTTITVEVEPRGSQATISYTLTGFRELPARIAIFSQSYDCQARKWGRVETQVTQQLLETKPRRLVRVIEEVDRLRLDGHGDLDSYFYFVNSPEQGDRYSLTNRFTTYLPSGVQEPVRLWVGLGSFIKPIKKSEMAEIGSC